MSRTLKDSPASKRKRRGNWGWPKGFLKRNTNRLSRRYRGAIPDGGAYKKMFDDAWNYD